MAIGYEGAPVTQVLSVIILAFSLFLRSYHDALLFDYNRVLQGQVLRLLCSQFIFANTAQTFVGLSLMYVCRQFERQLGSRKFGAFTFLLILLPLDDLTLSIGPLRNLRILSTPLLLALTHIYFHCWYYSMRMYPRVRHQNMSFWGYHYQTRHGRTSSGRSCFSMTWKKVLDLRLSAF